MKTFKVSKDNLWTISNFARNLQRFKQYEKWLTNHGEAWYKLTQEERSSEEYYEDEDRNKQKKVFDTDENIYIKVKDYHTQLNDHLNEFFTALKTTSKQKPDDEAQFAMTDLIVRANGKYDSLHKKLSHIIWTTAPTRIWDRATHNRTMSISYEMDENVRKYSRD